jgi:hypothetical protein
VLSLDDAEPNDSNELANLDDTPSRGSRYRPRGASRYRRGGDGKMPLPARVSFIFLMLGVGITTVVNQTTRRPGQGFDMQEVLIAGLVGGVCAALGFIVGKFFEGQSAADED